MRCARRRMMNGNVDLNVECITATGENEIATDWVPLKDTKASVSFMLHYSPTDSTPYAVQIISAIDADTNVTFTISKGGDVENRLKHLEMYNNYIYPREEPFYNGTFEGDMVWNITMDSYGLTINGKQVATNRRTMPNVNSMNILQRGKSITTCDIYSIQCWNNGILERDFVPAKKNGIYGLYDKVKKKFWRSSTGVDFLGKDK